jgi:hypothetical protein
MDCVAVVALVAMQDSARRQPFKELRSSRATRVAYLDSGTMRPCIELRDFLEAELSMPPTSVPPLLFANLYSDNVAPAAPEIMAALAHVNAGPAQPYGQDPESKALKIAFSELFGTEVWVMPVSTGTAANAIALSALTPPYGTVVCSDRAHIETSECGATELFSGGAKLTQVPSKSGRMSADALEEVIRNAGKGLPHRSQPAAVSLTIGTERGTVYPVSEIARIAEVARRHGLHLHIGLVTDVVDSQSIPTAHSDGNCSASWRSPSSSGSFPRMRVTYARTLIGRQSGLMRLQLTAHLPEPSSVRSERAPTLAASQ